MKMKITLFFLLSAVSFTFAQQKWNLDKSHSNVNFTVTHMLISEVDGRFDDFNVSVVSPSVDQFDGSEVTFTAQTASVNTGNDRRDGHLKSDDFFNAEEYPEMKFEGIVEKLGDAYFLVGDLTIRDVTKEERFEVDYLGSLDSSRGKMAGFKINGTIERFTYNLKWDRAIESGDLVVSREVDIHCNIKLRQAREEENN
jgi:polyisoprenoid-binding protein YceI